MPRFQLPNLYLAGFDSMLTLQDAQVEKIADFLKNIPVGTGPQNFAIMAEVGLGEKNAVDPRLIGTLYSLGNFRLSEDGFSIEELTNAISESYFEQSVNRNILTQEQRDRFKWILSKFFSVSDNLTVSFKAFQLMAEKENVMRDNRIVTDIRLLFKEELTDTPRQGLVIHQLKIEAEDTGETISHFFSLTSTDLEKLQVQINRALEKENLIRKDYQGLIDFIKITD